MSEDKDLSNISEVFAPFAFRDLPKALPVKDEQGNYIQGIKAHIDHDEDGNVVVDIEVG